MLPIQLHKEAIHRTTKIFPSFLVSHPSVVLSFHPLIAVTQFFINTNLTPFTQVSPLPISQITTMGFLKGEAKGTNGIRTVSSRLGVVRQKGNSARGQFTVLKNAGPKDQIPITNLTTTTIAPITNNEPTNNLHLLANAAETPLVSPDGVGGSKKQGKKKRRNQNKATREANEAMNDEAKAKAKKQKTNNPESSSITPSNEDIHFLVANPWVFGESLINLPPKRPRLSPISENVAVVKIEPVEGSDSRLLASLFGGEIAVRRNVFLDGIIFMVALGLRNGVGSWG